MNLNELIDIPDLQNLLENFSSFSGAPTAVLDLEGKILIATGWQDICTKFHRINPDTACRCWESDVVLAEKLKEGETYNIYKCKNGLVDVAVPIIVNNEHIANFYTGQFLFNKPDIDYFIKQAEDSGFDRNTYIEALSRVPVYTEEYVRKMMEFLTNMVTLIGEASLAKKNVEDIREKLIHDLNESEKNLKKLSGLLPICASCKKVRNDAGYWEQIEDYISKHSEADFSHSFCPDCARRLYPDLFKE